MRRKQRIRLSEATLHKIIRKCVNEAVNEISDKTICNAAYKADDRYNPYHDTETNRQLRQRIKFSDAVGKMTNDPNNAYLNQIVDDVNKEYVDTDYYEYWHCQDLAQDISDYYHIPLDVAHEVLRRALPSEEEYASWHEDEEDD